MNKIRKLFSNFISRLRGYIIIPSKRVFNMGFSFSCDSICMEINSDLPVNVYVLDMENYCLYYNSKKFETFYEKKENKSHYIFLNKIYKKMYVVVENRNEVQVKLKKKCKNFIGLAIRVVKGKDKKL